MIKKEFIFSLAKKDTWAGQKKAVEFALNLFIDNTKTDLKITVENYKPKGDKALRGYWLLLGVVEKWMQEQGNSYNKEELSDYFKLQVSHSMKLNGQFIPRSISNKSDCTFEDLKKLIDYIVRFGDENNIKGCELRNGQEQEFIDYYKIV